MRNLRIITTCAAIMLTTQVKALEVSVMNKNTSNLGFEQRLNALMAEIESLRSQLGNSTTTIQQLEQKIQQNVTNINNNGQNITNNKQSINNNVQKINYNSQSTNNHYRAIQNNTTRVTKLEQTTSAVASTPSKPSAPANSGPMYWRATGKTEKGGCGRKAISPSGNYISISSICHSKGAKGYYEASSKRSGTSKNRIYCGYAKVAICQ